MSRPIVGWSALQSAVDVALGGQNVEPIKLALAGNDLRMLAALLGATEIREVDTRQDLPALHDYFTQRGWKSSFDRNVARTQPAASAPAATTAAPANNGPPRAASITVSVIVAVLVVCGLAFTKALSDRGWALPELPTTEIVLETDPAPLPEGEQAPAPAEPGVFDSTLTTVSNFGRQNGVVAMEAADLLQQKSLLAVVGFGLLTFLFNLGPVQKGFGIAGRVLGSTAHLGSLVGLGIKLFGTVLTGLGAMVHESGHQVARGSNYVGDKLGYEVPGADELVALNPARLVTTGLLGDAFNSVTGQADRATKETKSPSPARR